MTYKSGAETAPDRRSEALWPIFVAVLAAMALTLLRPQKCGSALSGSPVQDSGGCQLPSVLGV
jgi:hypothetical protein